jgi:hypothetical protein
MRERCGCPDCDPPVTGCVNPLLDEAERLRTTLLSIAAFSKHPHPAPCGTDPCVLCLIESACAEALGDSA